MAKVGEIEFALYDEKGNTVMSELQTVHKKIDNISSTLYGKVDGKISLTGIEKKYNIKRDKK